MDKLLTVDELIKILAKHNHKELHVHHTWKPGHKNFNGKNHQTLQDNMRSFHINSRKFSDIAQHVTLFPDGKFLTGRDFDTDPASIKGYNKGAFCVEMLGNFDKGNDKFEGKQKEAMLKLAKFFDNRKKYIRFHNENAPKTCPGTSIVKSEFMKEVRDFNDKPKESKAVPIIKKSDKIEIKKDNVKTLKKGSKGIEVKQLQMNLNKLNFKCGTPDGIFGDKTLDAVKRFQSVHLPKEVDGIAGAKTLGLINKLLKNN